MFLYGVTLLNTVLRFSCTVERYSNTVKRFYKLVLRYSKPWLRFKINRYKRANEIK